MITYIRVYTEQDARDLIEFLLETKAVSFAWYQPAHEDAEVHTDEGFVVAWTL